MISNWIRKKPWLSPLLISLAVVAILLASIPVWYCILWGNERMIALGTRISPVLILVITSCALVIGLDIFNHIRREWLLVLLITSLLTAAGIGIQSILLGRLEQPDPFGIKERLASQVFSTLVTLVLVITLVKLPQQERYFWILTIALTAAFFFIQWFTFPKKLWRTKPYITLLAPFFILGFPLIASSIARIWNRLVPRTQKVVISLAKVGAIITLLLLAILYYQATLKHSLTINKKINSSDQAFYIAFVKDVQQSGFTSTGDHNRMPLYPYFQALFYQPEMSDKAFFLQGKHINIILSLVFLGLLFVIFIKQLRFFHAFLLVLIVGFSLYIFKAPYLQAEIMFFTLAFISFLLMLRMLNRPTWLLASATGFVVGLTYLTKGTVLPSVLLFIMLFVARFGLCALRNRKQFGQTYQKELARQVGLLLVFLSLFAATIYPYVKAVEERFGRYFYNVNTSVYIWYESFDQALQEEAKYHFTQAWPDNLPEDQTPGLKKYLRDHTTQQIVERFMIGIGKVYQNIQAQHGVTNYFFTYFLIFTIAILLDIKTSVSTIRDHPFPVLFTILYFLGYLVAFSWYSPIAGGRRFLFGLFIPFLWVVFIAIDQIIKKQTQSENHTPMGMKLGKFISVANLLVAITLIYNIWLVLTRVLFFGRFGS